MIQRGASPPWIVPYCRLCDQPVEAFQIENPKNDFFAVEVRAECCGKTQGRRVTWDELAQIKRTNAKLWVVVRKGELQTVAEDRQRWFKRAV